MDDKASLPEAMSTSHCADKIKFLGSKQKARHTIAGVDGTISRKLKIGRDSAIDVNVASEEKEQLQLADKAWKRKRKSMVSKVKYGLIVMLWMNKLSHTHFKLFI